MGIDLNSLPVTPADIAAARKTIRAVAFNTPLLVSPALDELTGARVFLKAETLQRTGSFKFRGAFNKLSSIPQEARKAGVVAFSSGNHAQGVAAAAQLLGMPAVIVMPADSPIMKRERTKAYGAEVVLYDRRNEDRAAIAQRICNERGATLVPPFDDVKIIAGQGTAGLEIADDLFARAIVPDVVVVPASGGGFAAGVFVAMRSRFPEVVNFIAEPEGFDDHARSLASGERVIDEVQGQTICDALMSPFPGEITFAINRHLASAGVSASDREVGEAMKFAFRELKLVVEPGGAVALATLLNGRFACKGKTVVIVLSGGNVDAELFSRMIA